MSQACTRCYANPEERAAFQRELQALAIAKRENRGYLAADRDGMPLFQEKIRATADGTGFEFRGMALSPTVQQAGPAGVTPSQLLPAAEGAYSAGSPCGSQTSTYRGSVMPTWHPSAMPPTPVRPRCFNTLTVRGSGPRRWGPTGSDCWWAIGQGR